MIQTRTQKADGETLFVVTLNKGVSIEGQQGDNDYVGSKKH